MSKLRSYQLSIEYPRDFKIIHNNKTTFLANAFVLSSVSEYFKEKYFNEKIKSLETNDKLNDNDFLLFLQLVHGQQADLTLNSAISILKLANQWKCPPIKKLLETFLNGESETEVKIASLIGDFDMEDKLPTKDSFKSTSELNNMYKSESMHLMPLKLIKAVIEISVELNINRELLKRFLILHFRKYPNLKGEFFSIIENSKIKQDHLFELISDKTIFKTSNNYKSGKIIEPSLQSKKKNNLPKIDKKARTASPNFPNSPRGQFLKMSLPYFGVFAQLSLESDGEPFLNKFLKISTTSHDPQNFTNSSNRDNFIITGDEPFIIFNLPEPVKIDSYTIRNSFKWNSREWTLSGSKENENEWKIIDEQESPEELIKPHKSIDIKLNQKSSSYSNFKLTSHKFFPEDNTKALIISSLELFNSDDYPDGVFKKLRNDGKSINVVTSSNNPQILISPRHKQQWYSANETHQSITFEFLKHRIQPCRYTLKSGKFWHMRSWELTGSFDGKVWFQLDKKTNAMQMDRKFVPNVWKCQGFNECRFIKLTQIGNTYDGVNILCLSGIEFFGKIISNDGQVKKPLRKTIPSKVISTQKSDTSKSKCDASSKEKSETSKPKTDNDIKNEQKEKKKKNQNDEKKNDSDKDKTEENKLKKKEEDKKIEKPKSKEKADSSQTKTDAKSQPKDEKIPQKFEKPKKPLLPDNYVEKLKTSNTFTQNEKTQDQSIKLEETKFENSTEPDKKAKEKEEKKKKEEADKKAKEKEEKKKKKEADKKAKEEADKKAKEKEEKKKKEEEEKKKKEEEEEAKKKEEADKKAKEESDKKVKEEADKKAKEKEEKKKKEEEEKKKKEEEEEAKKKEEADKKAKEESDKKVKEEADKKAKEEEEKKKKEEEEKKKKEEEEKKKKEEEEERKKKEEEERKKKEEEEAKKKEEEEAKKKEEEEAKKKEEEEKKKKEEEEKKKKEEEEEKKKKEEEERKKKEEEEKKKKEEEEAKKKEEEEAKKKEEEEKKKKEEEEKKKKEEEEEKKKKEEEERKKKEEEEAKKKEEEEAKKKEEEEAKKKEEEEKKKKEEEEKKKKEEEEEKKKKEEEEAKKKEEEEKKKKEEEEERRKKEEEEAKKKEEEEKKKKEETGEEQNSQEEIDVEEFSSGVDDDLIEIFDSSDVSKSSKSSDDDDLNKVTDVTDVIVESDASITVESDKEDTKSNKEDKNSSDVILDSDFLSDDDDPDVF